MVDGVGGLDFTILIHPVRSHIHRAIHLAAVGIEKAAGIVDGIGAAKIHIDRGAVLGRAARDAGVLPQLQLGKPTKVQAAAVFRLAAGDRSVQNSRLAVFGVAGNIQAAAVFACLAVLDAAAGDPDGAPVCHDTAAAHGRAAADDAAGHGKGRPGNPGANVYAAAAGAKAAGDSAVPDRTAADGDGAALAVDAAALHLSTRSALDAAGIDGAARQHKGRVHIHIHAAAKVREGLSRAIVILKPLAAGDEATGGEGLILMLLRRAAVGHGQGLAPRDAEDAVRGRRLVIAQDVAV